MNRIIIADDHPIIREGVKKILEKSGSVNSIEEVDSGEALLERLTQQTYDVLLLDISLPGRNGIEILADVKHIAPSLKVLMVSTYAEDQYAMRALKVGADGYIMKNKAPQELMNAIRKVSSGGKYVSPSLAENLASKLSHDSDSMPHELLSDRELQVLCMIAEGNSLREIAEALCLSKNTVSTYHSRILEKMEMKNDAELIHYAIKNNLVE